MYYIYFDESKYPKKNFIIGSFVFCKTDPTSFIRRTLTDNGFNPLIDEFKSSTHFGRNPEMINVREKLKYYFHDNCFFAIVVIPHSELKNLGYISLKALNSFIKLNGFQNDNIIYFDEGIFKSKIKAIDFIKNQGLDKNTFHLEQNSKIITGIQLADLCSHCLTTILRECCGDLVKMIRDPEYSDDEEDYKIKIGFDIWASIRYSFLREQNKMYFEDADQETNFTYEVEPYGLYISDKCDTELTLNARKSFGNVYLGCIH